MTTLLSKAQKLIQKIRSDRHDIEDWPKDSLDAFLELEQAIAQEQSNKNAVPLDMVRFGGRCNIHPVNIMPCTSCEGILQRKQASKDVAQIIGDLDAKMHKSFASQAASTKPVVSQKTAETVDKDCGNCKKFSTNSLTGGPVCISCKDYSNWEPKP